MGEVWQATRQIRAFLNADGKQVEELSPDAAALMGDSLTTLRGEMERFSGASPMKKRIWVFLGLSLVLVAGAWKYVRHGPNKGNRVLGLFVPMRKNELEITVRVSRHEQLKLNDAATLSHEHIHLLQHKYTDVHARTVKNPHSLLTDKTLAFAEPELKFLLYILEKKEMEARLHELVLSFYRAHQQLPKSIFAFYGMLAANNQIGWMAKSTFLSMKVPFEKFVEYDERENLYVEQLESVHLFMREELARKYLTEVLAVMYGNLLKYYGDRLASERFLDQIARPNYYDDLYAV